jgi:hypothetical protein
LDINSVILRHLLSVFSYLLNAALSAIATQTLFERLYKMIFDDNTVFYSKTDKAFIAISLLIAPFAALPLGSLQIQNAQNGNVLQTLLIAPTFIGPMCVRSRAIYDALSRALSFTTKALKKDDEQNRRRELLLITLDRFCQSVKDFNSETVESLHVMLPQRMGTMV